MYLLQLTALLLLLLPLISAKYYDYPQAQSSASDTLYARQLASEPFTSRPSIANVPQSEPYAPQPQTYTNTRMTTIPGFFKIQPYGTDVRSHRLLDMHMDQNNIVAIDPSLYSPENRLGNKNIEFMEAWGNFKRKFLKLDVGVPAHISHKLLYLARHGEGEHNAAEADIGEKDWECYWAMQGKKDQMSWSPDAKLTQQGIMEANRMAAAWRRQMSLGAPFPETHFVSPLSRSIQTMNLTWGTIYGWRNPASARIRPVVKELLRETLSLHASDERSSLTELYKTNPYLLFSPLPEQKTNGSRYTFPPTYLPDIDPLFDYHRESYSMRDLRVKTVLQEILANDASSAKVIGITAHWGVIQSALKVLGYPDVVNIGTAGTIPVVVKVEKYGGLADGGWYDAYREKDRGELALRSVCPGYPEILVQGQYAVPGGMGIDT